MEYLWICVLFAWEWKYHIHVNGVAHSLVLKKRSWVTRKWPVDYVALTHCACRRCVAHFWYVSSSSRYFYDKMYLVLSCQSELWKCGTFQWITFSWSNFTVEFVKCEPQTRFIDYWKGKKIQNKLNVCRWPQHSSYPLGISGFPGELLLFDEVNSSFHLVTGKL